MKIVISLFALLFVSGSASAADEIRVKCGRPFWGTVLHLQADGSPLYADVGLGYGSRKMECMGMNPFGGQRTGMQSYICGLHYSTQQSIVEEGIFFNFDGKAYTATYAVKYTPDPLSLSYRSEIGPCAIN